MEKLTVCMLSNLFYSVHLVYLCLPSSGWDTGTKKLLSCGKGERQVWWQIALSVHPQHPEAVGSGGECSELEAIPPLMGSLCCRRFWFTRMGWVFIRKFPVVKLGLNLKYLLFSRSVVSDSLQPHGLQHARFPCPSPSPEACSNSCLLSRFPFNHPVLCCPPLLLSLFPSIRVCVV